MTQKVKLLLLGGFIALLLISVLAGCKKPVPETNPTAPRIGILDMERTLRAHPRYNEVQKLEQEIAKLQAEATRVTGDYAQKSFAGVNQADISNQVDAGYQQALDQQINAQLAQKRSELAATLEARVQVVQQDTHHQLTDYAKELDQTYQPEILSLQLKMQTVQMNQEEREAVKKQVATLQEQRAEKLQIRQEQLDKEIRPQIEQEQKLVEEQLRQFHAGLVSEATSQLNDQRKALATRIETGRLAVPADEPKNTAQLQVLQEQRAKLLQIIIKELKDITARIAAQESLEIVIIKYQKNIQAIDITNAVIAEIK